MTTLRSVAKFGTGVARALVAAHHVTCVARAGEAALSVGARLAAHTLRAFVSVDTRSVVGWIQRVAVEAEAVWDRAVTAVISGGGAAMVAASAAAEVISGAVCLAATFTHGIESNKCSCDSPSLSFNHKPRA